MMFKKKRKKKRINEGEENEGKISDGIETVTVDYIAQLAGWLVGWMVDCTTIMSI